MKIFIDPGHGGTDPGAVGPSGLKESEINLDVSLMLGDELAGFGYDIAYSRTEEKAVSLEERAKKANAYGADIFISIHCNSSSNQAAEGSETFYYKPNTAAQFMARIIVDNLTQYNGQPNRGAKQGNYYVLRKTAMPATLVELAFISNLEEEYLLSTEDFRKLCAEGIAQGVLEFTNISQ